MPTAPQPTGRRKAQKPAKRGTPVKNSILLIILAAILAVIVIVLPKEPVQTSATVLVSGGSAVGDGTAEELPLRISEVMSSNKSAYPDDKGNYADWVEIENTGADPVSLEGIGLSDRADRVKFIFPAIELAGGGRIIVYCDGTNAVDKNSALHARFNISALGETLYLFDRNSVAFNSVEVPALYADVSYALTNDGWSITEQYTPGYPNTEAGYAAMRGATFTSASSGLVLNEICPANRTTIADEDGDYSDWIEIYNGSSVPIDLHNYALSDDETQRVKWRFPQGTVIQPGEHYIVFASGKNRMGGGGLTAHANFSLAAEGETVLLCDILGQMVDSTTYDNIDKDQSWERVEGTEGWQVFKQPTPGLANNRSGEIEMDAIMRARNTSGVYISEVMTSSTGVETIYGKTSFDWIELANLGNSAVNVKDWGLSDKVGRPRKWQFPDVTIEPGGYLLIFASGLTESPTGSSALHADFRLSTLGETVVLADSQGNIVDKLVVPMLEVDTSYGRNFDQGGLFYFDTPTPGEMNGTGFVGYAAAPTVEMNGGVYTRAVTVAISAPQGVQIRYTLDGSEPTESNGADYAGPVSITSAAVLRARGFVDGLQPSEIVTESFLVNVYSTLPVISLTVDPVDLWDPLTGIYADGDLEEEDFVKVPFKKTTYYKMKHDSSLRERAGNFEYFSEDGIQQVNQGVGVMLHGNFSMDIAQKSFRITAKAKYGSKTLDYAFFEDREFTQYPALILRNGGNDGSYSRIVDALQSKIIDWTDSDIITMASRPVIVYLNGEYWGHYNLRERINARYIAQYEGYSDENNIDLLKGDITVLDGSSTNFNSLLKYVKVHDLNDPEALQTVLDWVDVDNLFDFYIFETYFGNTDAANIKYYRDRTTGSKWRWLVFDMDWGYWMRATDTVNIWLRKEGSGDKHIDNSIIRALLNVPEMRDKFLKRYGELFQEYLSDTDRQIALVDEMVAEIDQPLTRHFVRWAGETREAVAFDPPKEPEAAYNYWKNRITRLKNIVCARPYYVWGHVQDFFELTDEQMLGYFGPRSEETKDIY